MLNVIPVRPFVSPSRLIRLCEIRSSAILLIAVFDSLSTRAISE